MSFCKLESRVQSNKPIYLLGTNIKTHVWWYKSTVDNNGTKRVTCEIRIFNSKNNDEQTIIDHLKKISASDISMNTSTIYATIDGKFLCDIPYGTEAARILYG